MKLPFLVIAGLLPATSAQGQRAIMPIEVFACERHDDLIKGIRLLKDRDLERIFIFYSSYFPVACTWIKPNSEVLVEKAMQSGELNFECVRRQGKAPCWWTLGVSSKF
jgi:hypothetical protein